MKKVVITLLFIVSYFEIVKPQNDTVVISEEKIDFTALDKYDEIYRLFIEENKEAKHLWKFNLMSGISVEYEQKIGKSLSIDNSISFNNIFLYYPSSLYPLIIKNLIIIPSPALYIDIKLYYNLNKRRNEGKRVNNFSGNYFSIGFYTGSSNYEYKMPFLKPIYYSGKFGLTIKYGLQRRIGNVGFFEPYIGILLPIDSYSQTNITPILGLKGGFAIESFKKIRKQK